MEGRTVCFNKETGMIEAPHKEGIDAKCVFHYGNI